MSASSDWIFCESRSASATGTEGDDSRPATRSDSITRESSFSRGWIESSAGLVEGSAGLGMSAAAWRAGRGAFSVNFPAAVSGFWASAFAAGALRGSLRKTRGGSAAILRLAGALWVTGSGGNPATGAASGAGAAGTTGNATCAGTAGLKGCARAAPAGAAVSLETSASKT